MKEITFNEFDGLMIPSNYQDYLFNIRDVVITDLEHITGSNQKVIESYLHKLKKMEAFYK